MEQITLAAGTVVKIGGFPFRLTRDTAVEGRAKNAELAGVALMEAPSTADAVLAEVAKWALAGHIGEMGVTVEACKAIRTAAASSAAPPLEPQPSTPGENGFAPLPSEPYPEPAPQPAAWRREWDGDESDLGHWLYTEDEEETKDGYQWQPLYDHPTSS